MGPYGLCTLSTVGSLSPRACQAAGRSAGPLPILWGREGLSLEPGPAKFSSAVTLRVWTSCDDFVTLDRMAAIQVWGEPLGWTGGGPCAVPEGLFAVTFWVRVTWEPSRLESGHQGDPDLP